MRFLILAVLGFTLAAVPAMGQTNSGNNGSGETGGAGHVFGSANCPQHISCSEFLSSSDLTANANSCVAEYFGYSSPDGLFEDADLDANNCLTAKPNVIPKGMGSQLSPRCCMAQLQDNVCTFRCDLVTIK